MSEKYKLHYTVPLSRLTRLGRQAMRKSHRGLWIVSLIFRLFIIVPALVFLLRPAWARAMMESLGGIFGVPEQGGFIFIFLFLAILIGGYWGLRKMSRALIGEKIDFEQTITLSLIENTEKATGGVRIISKDMEYFLKWPGIHQVQKHKDGFALAHGVFYFFIPFTAFENSDQQKGFIRDILHHINPQALAQSQPFFPDIIV